MQNPVEEKPTGLLRWTAHGGHLYLQQRWQITEFHMGGPINQRFEWRDVPFEIDE